MGTGLFDDLLPSAAAKPSTGLFDDLLKAAPPSVPQYDQMGNYIGDMPAQDQPHGEAGVGTDIAKTIPAALARGVIGLASFPTNIGRAADLAVRNVPRLIGKPAISEEEFYGTTPKINPGNVITPEELQSGLEAVTGPLYEPKTTAGKYANAVGEAIPGAVIGPAAGARGVLSNTLKYAVTPGVAKQAVEDATGSPGLGTIAGIATGGVTALATRPGYGDWAVSRATRNMTPQQVRDAEELYNLGQLPGSVPITRAEAAQSVTQGATDLGNIQRVVEGTGEMLPFFAQRGNQVRGSVGNVIESVAPAPANAFMTGPQVGQAATRAVNNIRQDINTQTAPLYRQAEQSSVDPALLAQIHADPVYQDVFNEVRNTPALNAGIENLGADNPSVIHRVLVRLRERGQNAATPGEASSSNIAAGSYGAAQEIPRAAVEAATGSNPATGAVGSFEAAQAQQAALRGQRLDPLMAGPIGRLVEAQSPSTRQAINIMFGPETQVANAAPEIGTAIRTIVGQNPEAASQLVRAHLEKTFNDAMAEKTLPNVSTGGASFRAKLVGNPMAAANMAAAIDALPHGAQILPGFDRLLRVLEATGWRQGIGSQTSFNARQMHLMQGGRIDDGKAIIASLGLRAPTQVMDTIKEWNLGRNTERLAYLLTDPRAADAWHMLATSSNTGRASFAVARLALMANQDRIDRQLSKRDKQ